MPCFGWLRWIAIVIAIHRQVTVSLRRGTCTGRRQILSPEQKLPVSIVKRGLASEEVGGGEVPDPSFTASVSAESSHVLQVVSNYDL